MNTIKHILLGTLLLAFTAVFAKPKVYILATGGTIAGTGASATSSAYKAGGVDVSQLLQAVPAIGDIAEVKSEQIVNIGSQDMNVETWLKLAKRINELAKDGSVDGIVVIHGTDTQEETAYFLNLTVKTNKPVVLVGSMRPSTAIGAEGPRNLFNAVACAGSELSKGKGVSIVMDDRIIGADDAQKTHTLSVGTFQDPNYGPLGYMYDGKPIYTRTPIKKHTFQSEFNVANLDKLPQVEVIMGYADASDMFIKTAVDKKVDGIVYAGMGNGNLSGKNLTALAQAVKKGVPVVRSARVPLGPTSQWDEVDDEANRFSTSWFLTPQKARILLMLALTKTKDYKEIQRMFVEY